MKLTRTALRSMILEEIHRSQVFNLLEAEEDKEEEKSADTSDTATEDLFGDDSGSDDTESEDDADSGDDSGSADTESEDDAKAQENMVPAEEAKEDAEEAAEEARKEGAKDAMELQKTVTGPLTRAVQAAFNDSIGSIKKVVDAVSDVNEGLLNIAAGRGRGMLSRLIFEAEQELEIDLPLYAQRIANLITNYDNILDIEKAIFDSAYKLLSDDEKFGRDIADEFRDILSRDYDLDFDHIHDPEKADQAVYGVGSKKPEGSA